MELISERKNILSKRFSDLTVFLLAGGLALNGCGDDSKTLPKLKFDSLDGGSSIIQVYPSAKTKANGTLPKYNGTYNDGASVAVECKTVGRTVHSDPSVGETNRTSNEWVRIKGTPGETQYATTVYIEHPKDLLEQLPEC